VPECDTERLYSCVPLNARNVCGIILPCYLSNVKQGQMMLGRALRALSGTP